MSNNIESPDKLATELLKGFHTQFAENQRTREQSFLKIIGFLGAFVLGYAYVFKNLSNDPETFSYSAVGSSIVLFFGCAIVTVIAYSFRRDQYVNTRIRKQADIIGDQKPFPTDYDPTHLFEKGRTIFTWMPDIFLFFFWLFPIFQTLILMSYSTKRNLRLSLCHSAANDTLTVLISIISILGSLSIFFWFGNKLRKKIHKWEKDSKKKTDLPTNKQ